MATMTIPVQASRLDGRSAHERRLRAEAYAPLRIEPLKDASGYYKSLHAVKVRGARISAKRKGLFGTKEFRFFQTGEAVHQLGWTQLRNDSSETKFLNSRELIREFFQANDFKDPRTISLRRGTELELKLPAAQHIYDWMRNDAGTLMVRTYEDSPEGAKERKLAEAEWSLASGLAQKGLRDSETKSWLNTAYENLDGRDRPAHSVLSGLLRA